MKKQKKTILAALLVAALLTGGVTALAAAGTSDNPLVTLSYLTDTFTKSILSQTQAKITSAQSSYEAKLDAKLSTSGGTSSGAYTVVTLSKGQYLSGQVGCEVMLRSGSAVCQSTGTTGLSDTTSGTAIGGGTALSQNHLYLFTENTQGVLATASATLLVRGTYTIQ